MGKPENETNSGRRVFACRVDLATPEIVEELARELGCIRINREGKLSGACGVMLDRIADGRLRVVPDDSWHAHHSP